MWSKTMKKACTKFIFSRTANLEPAIVLKMKLFTGNFHRLWQKILYQLFLETRFRGRSCCCIQHVSYCVFFSMYPNVFFYCFHMLPLHVFTFNMFLHVDKHIQAQIWGNVNHMRSKLPNLNLNFWWNLLTVLQGFAG